MSIIGEAGRREAQGPKSNAFKFNPTLCRRCNGDRSQPFDRACDAFMNHVEANRQQIANLRRIDLRDVYGSTWRGEAENLARYYVKHIGCRIADDLGGTDLGIDQELIDFLNGGPYPSVLQLEPCIELGLLAMDRALSARSALDGLPDYGTAGLGRIYAMKSVRDNSLSIPWSSLRYRWLEIRWQVGHPSAPYNPFTEPIVTLTRTDEVFRHRVRVLFMVKAAQHRLQMFARRIAG